MVFPWPSLRLVGRTSHGKPAWRAPADRDAGNLSLIPCFRAVESGGGNGLGWLIRGSYCLGTLAAERCGREQDEQAESLCDTHRFSIFSYGFQFLYQFLGRD